MGKKGNVRHIKSLNAPLFFGVHRKGNAYVTKPSAGRHSLERSIALAVLMKKLSLAQKSADAESIIKNGFVMVNGKVVSDTSYPIGINDIVEIPKEGKSFIVGINVRGQITISDVKKPDYNALLYKVTGKYKAQGNILMLRLHDGRVVKCSGETNVNDSVIINSKGAVTKTLKLGPGAKCMVVAGVHAGSSGTIKKIIEGSLRRKHSASVQQAGGAEFETHVENIMLTE